MANTWDTDGNAGLPEDWAFGEKPSSAKFNREIRDRIEYLFARIYLENAELVTGNDSSREDIPNDVSTSNLMTDSDGWNGVSPSADFLTARYLDGRTYMSIDKGVNWFQLSNSAPFSNYDDVRFSGSYNTAVTAGVWTDVTSDALDLSITTAGGRLMIGGFFSMSGTTNPGFNWRIIGDSGGDLGYLSPNTSGGIVVWPSVTYRNPVWVTDALPADTYTISPVVLGGTNGTVTLSGIADDANSIYDGAHMWAAEF
jgi:hypothetical protein